MHYITKFCECDYLATRLFNYDKLETCSVSFTVEEYQQKIKYIEVDTCIQ